MGNRAQIIIHDTSFPDADPVHLYTHWGGRDGVEGWLAEALGRGASRWEDASYLTRIVFADMVRDDPDGLTGFGISTVGAGDSGYDIEVYVGRGFVIDGDGNELTFDQFIDHVKGP